MFQLSLSRACAMISTVIPTTQNLNGCFALGDNPSHRRRSREGNYRSNSRDRSVCGFQLKITYSFFVGKIMEANFVTNQVKRPRTMCPRLTCRATRRMQRGLTKGEIERLGNPPWGLTAQICIRCGTIYSFGGSQWNEVVVRATQDAVLSTRCWRSL